MLDLLMITWWLGATLPLFLFGCLIYQQFVGSAQSNRQDFLEEITDSTLADQLNSFVTDVMTDPEFNRRIQSPHRDINQLATYLVNKTSSILRPGERDDLQKQLLDLLKEKKIC